LVIVMQRVVISAMDHCGPWITRLLNVQNP